MSSPELIAILGAASVLLVFVALADATGAVARRQVRRLHSYVTAEAAAGGLATPAPSSARAALLRGLRTLGRPLRPLHRDRARAAAEHALAEAGVSSLSGAEYLELRAGALVGGTLLGALLGTATGGPNGVVLLALVGAAMGRVLPALVLSRRARARRDQMLAALPGTLDMLALCADAGLGLDGAVNQVVRRWDNPLTAELRRFLLELRVGRDRRQAIREMAKRTGVKEIARFANAVVQADTLGVPLARVLQEQAAEVRLRRRQKAEESARKAPIKMLFPMVLLIFPALFIVILGPAVPRMLGGLGTGP